MALDELDALAALPPGQAIVSPKREPRHCVDAAMPPRAGPCSTICTFACPSTSAARSAALIVPIPVPASDNHRVLAEEGESNRAGRARAADACRRC